MGIKREYVVGTSVWCMGTLDQQSSRDLKGAQMSLIIPGGHVGGTGGDQS